MTHSDSLDWLALALPDDRARWREELAALIAAIEEHIAEVEAGRESAPFDSKNGRTKHD